MTKRFSLQWAIALTALTIALGVGVNSGSSTNVIDQWWHGVMTDVRTTVLVNIAEVFDQVGGHMIAVFGVPPVIGLFVLWKRGWKASVFTLATFAASYVLVQAIKHLFSRARPEDMLVLSDHGSYPSGHTANAATIAVVLYLLFPRLVVAILGGLWVLLMAISRTMVSAHWLTDTIGGTFIGIAATLFMAVWLLDWAMPTPQDSARTSPGTSSAPQTPHSEPDHPTQDLPPHGESR